MNVQLTPEQETFIRQSIEAGRFATPEQAAEAMLAVGVTRELRLAELRAELQIGIDQLERDEGIEITENSMKTLVDDIARLGHEQLAQEQSSTIL